MAFKLKNYVDFEEKDGKHYFTSEFSCECARKV